MKGCSHLGTIRRPIPRYFWVGRDCGSTKVCGPTSIYELE
jgi:hypothetical protein